jgi:hypothetical protein
MLALEAKGKGDESWTVKIVPAGWSRIFAKVT